MLVGHVEVIHLFIYVLYLIECLNGITRDEDGKMPRIVYLVLDEDNHWMRFFFYIPDVEFSVMDASSNDIQYNPITFELIEY